MKTTNKGLFIAITIIGVWGLSLLLLLTFDVGYINIALIIVGVLYQMFLFTGLFITAHDTMHGSVCPAHLLMEYVLMIPAINLILFWVSPALLSTLQLFYFGTYLRQGGHNNAHRAQSNAYSIFWSFITCYHFGYHWEHHEYPYVRWWYLPRIRKARNLPK